MDKDDCTHRELIQAHMPWFDMSVRPMKIESEYG